MKNRIEQIRREIDQNLFASCMLWFLICFVAKPMLTALAGPGSAVVLFLSFLLVIFGLAIGAVFIFPLKDSK